MKKFISKNNLVLLAIVVLSLFFRIFKITLVPPSLNWDEVSHGYNAYSILKTGGDEWGVKFPLIFRAYGDYKLPLYIYLTAVSVAGLGLNALSVRLVSILAGTGLVILAYLITKKITKDRIISLLAALLTSLSPWSLFVSRIAVEANLGAFLFALGLYFWIRFEDNSERKSPILTALSWGFSLYTYNSARVLVPIFTLGIIAIAVKKRVLKRLLVPVIILLIFFLPVVRQFFDKSGSARFDLVSLIDQGTISRIIQKRQTTKLPNLVAKIIFNRPTYFISYAIKNYFSNLSPNYLFFRGGSHYQFSQPNHELLYLVTAPFLFLGLVRVFRKGSKEEKIVVLWFFLGFIPSAITRDAPHVLRSILILPSPMILTALGLKWIVDRFGKGSFFKGNLLILVLVLSILVSFSRWWQDYQKIYPKAYSWAWQYGYKEAVGFVKENFEKYDLIYFTKRYGEPHEFVLFYFPWDPQKYQEDPNRKWDYHANWYWVDGFDKFVFVNDWEVGDVKCDSSTEFTPSTIEGLRTRAQTAKCLLITSPGNYPEEWNKIKTISFLDGKPAFDILERQKL